jgi:twitching motility protein PilJ
MGTNSTMGRIGNFGTKAWAWLLIGSAVVFAVNFGYGQFLSRQENNARALTAEMQVLSQQLAKFAQQAVQGKAEAFDDFTETKARIDTIVGALRLGSGSENVPGYEGNPLEIGAASGLKKVTTTWAKMTQDADRIIKSKQQVLDLTETATAFNVRIPRISAQLAEIVRGMTDSGAAASQINLANRQIVLADRMSRRVTEILAGGDTAVTAADALQRDAVVFENVLQGLREGNAEMAQVTNPAAVTALNNVAALYEESKKEIESILQASTDLAEVQQAATTISEDSDVLLAESRTCSRPSAA